MTGTHTTGSFSRMLRSIRVLVLAALAVLSCPGVGSAAAPVKVGYYENEVFQEGARPGAIKKGYAYEYYRKLSEYTGWKYEYVYGSYNELYKMLLEGRIDLLAGLAWKEEREGQILYPEFSMGSETYNLVKHEGDPDITTAYSSLNGKSIGVLNSSMVNSLEQFLAKHRIKARIIPYESYENLFADFDSNEISLLVAEGDGAYGRDNAEVLYPFDSSDYYLCVNARRQDLLEQLDEAQAQLFNEEPNYRPLLRSKYYQLSVSRQSFSRTEKDWIQSHSILRMGYLDNYMPYSDSDGDGKPTGIIRDLVPRILHALKLGQVTVQYSSYESYDQMVADMDRGAIDACFPVGGGLYFLEESGIYQSTPVLSTPPELVYNAALHADDKELYETIISHFAVNEANRMQDYCIQTNFPNAKISFYPSINACLDAVLKGETTCTTLNGYRNGILRNRKYRALSVRQLSAADDRSFGIKIGNEGLLKLINRGLYLIGNDYAQNLAYRYGEKLYVYTATDFIIDNTIFFASVILVMAGLIILILMRDANQTRRALNAAESANRAKTTFLNNISHDIRTPMNAIVGFTALAESNIDDKAQVKGYLEKITVSSGHLLSLLNDVLDMSRIESGKVTLNEEEVNLNRLLTDLETIVHANVKEKKLELTLGQQLTHADVITDKLRLNQVLLNILSNAIKFTPEGGRISLSLDELVRSGGTGPEGFENYRFRIRDNGIGMSREFQKVIFDEFTREKTSTVNGIQGTGLGMAITKRIVQMMGGDISVQSEEGKGSEFTVVVPCRINDHPTPAENRQEEVKTDFSGKRILLAEDVETNQIIAEAILTKVGLEVEIASDGSEAVQMMESHPAGYYDLIFMDIQMPKMDGYAATEKIRALSDPEKAGIPIVALTANAFQEDRSRSLEQGMDEYLAKPYEIPAVMAVLNRFLG
ncbi:MAG: transporter substrate-binding domain-containing protein [Treponema sp.]|nr:transporter substrate-binding domain-containing protein [Treponema sp.]